ncbi:MAG: PrgI family protein, partial [Clostridiales bacterium]|nr:PrgI family protein [Clostridiales bacterium]
MVIEINKDIEQYKETLVMGLTTKQFVFSLASIISGGGIVLGLYPLVGLTVSVYVAAPVIVPIALGGFYSYNGMGFYEVMGRKVQMAFKSRPLLYVSTEGAVRINEQYIEEAE